MPDYPKLENPPIVEAVFDVQVTIPEAVFFEKIEGISDQIASLYPKKEEDRRVEVQFLIEPEKAPKLQSANKPFLGGYRFTSEDKKSVVQYRKDGFSFHRLAPYSSWEDFTDAAGKAWEIYSEAFPALEIKRVGIRFVNRIGLPLVKGNIELNDFLAIHPPDFASKNISYTGFLTHCALTDLSSQLGANWILTPLNPQVDETTLMLALNIEVFDTTPRVQEGDPRTLWPSMRELKNALFFDTFTPKGRELLT